MDSSSVEEKAPIQEGGLLISGQTVTLETSIAIFCAQYLCSRSTMHLNVAKMGIQILKEQQCCELKTAWAACKSRRYRFAEASQLALRLPVVIKRAEKSDMVAAKHSKKISSALIEMRLNQIGVKNDKPSHDLSEDEFLKVQSILTQTGKYASQHLIMKSLRLTTREARKSFGIFRPKQASSHIADCIKQIDEARKKIEDLAARELKDGMENDEILQFVDEELEYFSSHYNIADLAKHIARNKTFNIADFAKTIKCEEDPILVRLALQQVFSYAEKNKTKLPQNLLYLRHSLGNPLLDPESGEPDVQDKQQDVVTVAHDPIQLMKVAKMVKRFTHSYVVRQKIKTLELLRSRKNVRSGRIPEILKQYPKIGEDIMEFVDANECGADRWRRTQATIIEAPEGKYKSTRKITHAAIQEHLRSKYGVTFSKSVIFYCRAQIRSNRKMSHDHYFLCNIKWMRGRKGFNIKFSCDTIYSNYCYHIKDFVEKQCKEVIIINSDDAATFRPDTLATNSQFRSLVRTGKNPLRPRTDYVNAYPSNIYISSYYVYKTAGHPEKAFAVVKPECSFDKTATQHHADLSNVILPELKSNKVSIWLYRRDGGVDEAPNITEVQFWIAYDHLFMEQYVTILTSRYAGGSFLNRVEFENGAIAQAHANLFLPSTVHGSNINWETKEGRQKLEENMNSAVDIYIDHVEGAPFGDVKIKYLRGSRTYKVDRNHLTIYLRGSKRAKEQMKKKQPKVWDLMEEVNRIAKAHQMPGCNRYFYGLSLCLQKGCVHPVCKKASEDQAFLEFMKSQCWYDGGPHIFEQILPVPDPKFPWGAKGCSRCKEQNKDTCRGHFMPAHEAVQAAMKDPDTQMKKTPGEIIDAHLKNSWRHGKDPYTGVEKVAAECLLHDEQVIWVIKHEMEKKERREELLRARKRAKELGLDTCPCCRKKDLNLLGGKCTRCDQFYHEACVDEIIDCNFECCEEEL